MARAVRLPDRPVRRSGSSVLRRSIHRCGVSARRRQKHLLRLRAGLVSFGGISCGGIPGGPYIVECDYDTFNFILTADDVKEATAATGVAITGNACDLSAVADQCSGCLTDGKYGNMGSNSTNAAWLVKAASEEENPTSLAGYGGASLQSGVAWCAGKPSSVPWFIVPVSSGCTSRFVDGIVDFGFSTANDGDGDGNGSKYGNNPTSAAWLVKATPEGGNPTSLAGIRWDKSPVRGGICRQFFW